MKLITTESHRTDVAPLSLIHTGNKCHDAHSELHWLNQATNLSCLLCGWLSVILAQILITNRLLVIRIIRSASTNVTALLTVFNRPIFPG